MAGPTPLSLGIYSFAAIGFSLKSLSRDQQTPWAELEVAQRFESLQWTGPKSKTITIKGVLFPLEFGGLDSLDGISAAAAAGQIMPLVTGGGDYLGIYVVTAVTDDQSALDANGTPRMDAYTITLRLYAGDVAGLDSIVSDLISLAT